MAEPSNPHNVEGENPETSSPVAGEEEDDGGSAPGGGLPPLKWSKASFDQLMISIQMPSEFGAVHPQDGDTGACAPAGYVTLWADSFIDGNLRLPLTVFVAECLEHYGVHISQMSPFGFIRIRHFESTFRALGLPVTVDNFRGFYQLTVNTGFFSFRERYGSVKLMTPPKGITKWKSKFFYVKAVAVVCNMTLRNVNEPIPAEDIAIPDAKNAEWFPRLRTIEHRWLKNTELWVLWMLLTRADKHARPIVREKTGEEVVELWKIFDPTFTGKVDIVQTAEGAGFNLTILHNFRVPTREALNAPLPQGKGTLGALGKFEPKGAPKKHAEKKQGDKPVRGRGKKKTEAPAVPPLVPQAAGISRSHFRRYTDYVVVSDTLEGLGVPGAGAATGGTTMGSKAADEKKRKAGKAVDAGEGKKPKIQVRRRAFVGQKKPAVVPGA